MNDVPIVEVVYNLKPYLTAEKLVFGVKTCGKKHVFETSIC